VKESFEELFSDSEKPDKHPSDFIEDFNFIVDSLEDEHIRRNVHTTRNVEEEESQKLEEEGEG